MKQKTLADFGMPKKEEAVPYFVGHVIDTFVKKNKIESARHIGSRVPVTTTTRITLTDILNLQKGDDFTITLQGFENAMDYLVKNGIFKVNKNGYFFTGNSYSTLTIEKDLVPYFEKWKKKWLLE